MPRLLGSWEGRPVEEWARRWGVPRVEVFDELPSTNDHLRALARAGASPFTVVTADSQTAGKGRAGNRWASPAGTGLWISFLVRGDRGVPPTLVPILVGLAVVRTLERLCPSSRPRIKWPNDIEVEGKKLGGILCEGTGAGTVVVGVGLNLFQGIENFDPGLKERATSMKMAGCRDVSRSRVAGELLSAARSLVNPPPALLDEPLRQEVLDHDTLNGRTVRTEVGVVGTARGIAADGALLVEVDGRVEEIRAGGVRVVESGESARMESRQYRAEGHTNRRGGA